tara:strand:+ start:183 stop:878 length:696 start_codon:yes stop_codon:yes gene_type:complete
MPRPEINDYIFYKIVNDDLPEYIYIGSTGCFYKRKCQHKSSCNNPNSQHYNCKLYKTIRENGGWDHWNILVIDEAKQLTLTEARIKEESLRKEYNGNLNMVKAYRSVEERKEQKKKNGKQIYELNKESILEKTKIYYESNKETILEKQKKYNEINKEIIFETRKNYRELNKELIAEKKKEHYELNKEVILKNAKEKMTCECGAVFVKHGKNRHINSLKHQQFCQPIDLSIT